ncbi:Uu.00g117710.m01.CDS01 [Anthostomella pinea]|uniref:Uu.00g117710.m01.CDS01 n=1 Tax=Anthostomella pinea TaxID=933095 RepID=A0AAI8VGB3_9PEZI|nr:Uu.00g117710.m01.CDS01 [Anthostomella pinea]
MTILTRPSRVFKRKTLTSSPSSSFDSLIQVQEPDLSYDERQQGFLLRKRKTVVAYCNDARREAMSDLRSGGAFRIGLALWTMTLVGCIVFLSIYGAYSTAFNWSTSACRPDGSFSPYADGYSYWAISGFFQINLGSGSLTFTEVKIIDISWDIAASTLIMDLQIIGRGGQALMAFLSWRAFADYLTTSMETSPVTYAAFFSLFLQQGPSILSTYRLARDFLSGRGLVSKVAMTFMVLNMLFVLGWPTFAGAMSGYATTSGAFVRDLNESYIPFSEFHQLAYIIHDGWRVGLDGDQPVGVLGEQSTEDPTIGALHGYKWFQVDCSDRSSYSLDNVDCSLQQNVSNYASQYGFYGLSDEESNFTDISLPSPTLNISAFYFDPWSELFGWEWSDPRTGEPAQPFANQSSISWTYSNNTYSVDNVQTHGSCQPVQDRFKWGFSFLQVFIMLVLLLVWTIGTYLMWLKAHLQLPLQEQPEVPRGWRSVLILAETISREIKENGLDASSLTDRELKREIRKHLQGGSISFDMPLARSGYSFRHGLWLWMQRDKVVDDLHKPFHVPLCHFVKFGEPPNPSKDAQDALFGVALSQSQEEVEKSIERTVVIENCGESASAVPPPISGRRYLLLSSGPAALRRSTSKVQTRPRHAWGGSRSPGTVASSHMQFENTHNSQPHHYIYCRPVHFQEATTHPSPHSFERPNMQFSPTLAAIIPLLTIAAADDGKVKVYTEKKMRGLEPGDQD